MALASQIGTQRHPLYRPHNPKVAGSNPAPLLRRSPLRRGFFRGRAGAGFERRWSDAGFERPHRTPAFNKGYDRNVY
jgi:hypothetical protein